ncbi:ATP-grasp domain-containing protein [Methylomonas rapida]|uniref:ATP-grasp domain-containing protein n=1 Tax=Methylomonas rapida TaxID=2963939 RepID=A0ABY7GE06_9GAMM|nr:ATP-grasp domain-containing protein [Methylomonas rapida]WAR43520.1 ATP-grasp domain-containing protein [Methylomonas rapida]
MKILVFEYITGGGLAGQDLPATLAAEGGMMLQALLDDLKSVLDLQLLLPLDSRCMHVSLPPDTHVTPVDAKTDLNQVLATLIAEADAVWLIAPETGGLLAELARRVIVAGKIFLLSDPDTVALCGDKLATYHCLLSHALPVVPSVSVAEWARLPFSACVIKPIDGVGCEGSRILQNASEFQATVAGLDDPSRYLAQPLLAGRAVSLSCLCKRGRGWLLCCNEQQVDKTGHSFNLHGCLVNAPNPRQAFYQTLVRQIAAAMPGLWGYIGIDLIETTDQGPLILEINPRLTTSYVGIQRATGINVAEQVLRLLEGEPDLTFSGVGPIQVTIH